LLILGVLTAGSARTLVKDIVSGVIDIYYGKPFQIR
jgi:hypothetical protein